MGTGIGPPSRVAYRRTAGVTCDALEAERETTHLRNPAPEINPVALAADAGVGNISLAMIIDPVSNMTSAFRIKYGIRIRVPTGGYKCNKYNQCQKRINIFHVGLVNLKTKKFREKDALIRGI